MTAPHSETVLSDEDRARIKQVVCEVLDVQPAEITPAGLFTDEVNADSMSLLAMSASLERVFDVEIEETELDQMTSLNGVFSVVGAAIAAARTAR
jgi:acyl carrier protein